MKRISTLLFLPLMAASLTAATVTRYTGSRIYWDARTPVTIFNGGGYARLIELQDGRLLACCESGGIKVSFSTNKGKTWSTPTLIAPNQSTVPNCVPDLIQLSDGTIVVGYNPRPSSPYDEERCFGIRLRRSTDNGRTWSDEIKVYDGGHTFEDGCWEPAFLQLPSGELQLYFADESPYTTNADQQISLCRSTDGGLTWTSPQCISYRQGYRDGMPVPAIVPGGNYIAVAIEDNGWSGVGDFLPTIVRCTLSNNWRTASSCVTGNSNLRTRAVSSKYSPIATGGAPYMRVLANGETILSHQSKYGEGDNHKMYVYVGNKTAKDFKAMSCPFRQQLGTTKNALWNSLSVLDDGTVVAVGGISGKVMMMKGYALADFQVPYASPQVDGRASTSDGYYTNNAHQVILGCETGTHTYADFAYDADSLYMTCQAMDNTRTSQDAIIFYVEGTGASTNVPMSTAHRYTLHADGTLLAAVGNGKEWVEADASAAHAVTLSLSASYRTELAIPWSALGLSAAPYGQTVTVNLEVNNNDALEVIPDAKATEPSTWVPLRLLEPSPDALSSSPAKAVSATTYDLSGRPATRGLLVQKGRKTYRP